MRQAFSQHLMLGSYASAQLCEVNIDIPILQMRSQLEESGMTQVTMGQS